MHKAYGHAQHLRTPRFHLRAALTNEDRPCVHHFATKALYTQPFAMRLTTVARATDSFFMCHLSVTLLTIFGIVVRISPFCALRFDSADLDKGKALTVSVLHLITLTAFLLENDNLVALKVLDNLS